ncbi:MAG: adenosylcobinamide-GDP ribazoletransferase [Sutterellaceae bacterium]|nr:adenosylcobinamide-GDP ribazoletransferase [Sutterellaceae bacterium]
MLDRLLAALMFFTRLPLWRLKTVDAGCFRHVVDYWPFAGWLTGGVMAFTFWFCALFLPVTVAALLAMAVRIALTGALHEDGLADFFDAFGGNNSRERTLAIMKDSHIGTYGVLGLTLYAGLLFSALTALPRAAVPALIFTGDIYAKAVGSMIIQQLPYARREEESKARVIYEQPAGRGALAHFLRCLAALLPAAVWCYLEPCGLQVWMLLVPIAVELGLVALMKRRIQGYTGDCCGAVFLVCELSFYLACLCRPLT